MFRVVTDSTSDVPPEWCQQYGIEVVPLRVLFGEESFRDRVDLSTDEFFARLRQADRLPTTSAPSPGDFATVYETSAPAALHIIDTAGDPAKCAFTSAMLP